MFMMIMSKKDVTRIICDIHIHLTCTVNIKWIIIQQIIDSFLTTKGTDTSLSSYHAENESPITNKNTSSPVMSSRNNPNDLFGSAISLERYTGSENIEDHPAMALIEQAEEAEKNDDIETAAVHYESAIKQFNNTIHEIDNNKIKRKWREKVNDYEIQKLRIQRKLRLRKKMDKSHLRPGGRRHGRSATMQPRRSKSKKSVDYTNDVKNPEQKKEGGGGGDNNDNNGDGGDKKKGDKKDQDSAFRSRLEADIITEKPNVSFKDVQGLANVKLAIYETVILPQKRPELFTGLRAPAMG